MATISTHNGSAVRQAHNTRDERCVAKEPHIRPDGIYEVWHHETIADAYERIFGDAVVRFNEQQKRTDRKIDNYLESVRSDDRRHDAYEMIIGVYGAEVSDQDGKDIMREFVDSWNERNPNLELIGAYYHADEQGKNPHVHIDYVPVAHGYKRGMDTQNGLVKAFGEMGICKTGKETAQIQWERRENSCLERLCRERGLQIEHPQSGKENVKHLHTVEYKASEQAKEAIKHLNGLNQSIENAKQQKREALRERDAVRVETDVREAVSRAVEPFKDQKVWMPEILAETPEKEKTLFTAHKPATVTIKKSDYEDLVKQIHTLDHTIDRAERAANRMERASEDYIQAAETIHQNKIDSYEVAVDSRVLRAEYQRDYAQDRMEQAEERERIARERLKKAEKQAKESTKQVEEYESVLKYYSKEWQQMIENTERILALEEDFDRIEGFSNPTTCSEYMYECRKHNLPYRTDIKEAMENHQRSRSREWEWER